MVTSFEEGSKINWGVVGRLTDNLIFQSGSINMLINHQQHRSGLAVSSLQWAARVIAAGLVIAPAPLLASVEQEVGVTAASNIDAMGKPPVSPARDLDTGVEVYFQEVVSTDTNGRAQLLFQDGTALTVGPNSDLVIDQYVYDPTTGIGEMAIDISKGVFRLVGGKISKNNPIFFNTPSATVAIRGGVFTGTVTESSTDMVLLFGEIMMTLPSGETSGTTVPGTNITATVAEDRSGSLSRQPVNPKRLASINETLEKSSIQEDVTDALDRIQNTTAESTHNTDQKEGDLSRKESSADTAEMGEEEIRLQRAEREEFQEIKKAVLGKVREREDAQNTADRKLDDKSQAQTNLRSKEESLADQKSSTKSAVAKRIDLGEQIKGAKIKREAASAKISDIQTRLATDESLSLTERKELRAQLKDLKGTRAETNRFLKTAVSKREDSNQQKQDAKRSSKAASTAARGARRDLNETKDALKIARKDRREARKDARKALRGGSGDLSGLSKKQQKKIVALAKDLSTKGPASVPGLTTPDGSRDSKEIAETGIVTSKSETGTDAPIVTDIDEDGDAILGCDSHTDCASIKILAVDEAVGSSVGSVTSDTPKVKTKAAVSTKKTEKVATRKAKKSLEKAAEKAKKKKAKEAKKAAENEKKKDEKKRAKEAKKAAEKKKAAEEKKKKKKKCDESDPDCTASRVTAIAFREDHAGSTLRADAYIYGKPVGTVLSAESSMLCDECRFLTWSRQPLTSSGEIIGLHYWVQGASATAKNLAAAAGKTATYRGGMAGSVNQAGALTEKTGHFSSRVDFGISHYQVTNFDADFDRHQFSGSSGITPNSQPFGVTAGSHSGRGTSGLTLNASGYFGGNPSSPGAPPPEMGGSFSITGGDYSANGVFVGSR